MPVLGPIPDLQQSVQTSLPGDSVPGSSLRTTALGPFLLPLALELWWPSMSVSHSCPENGLRRQKIT